MRFALAALPLIALAAPGVAQSSYRAVGAESVWTLTIDARTMRFEEPGERPVVVPRPAAQPSGSGERYVTRSLIVDTTRARCTEGASERVYRDMVLVDVGQRSLRGCGGPIKDERPVATKAGKPPAQVGQIVRPERAKAIEPAAPVTKALPPAPANPGQRSMLTDTRWTVWQVNGRAIEASRPLLVHFSSDLVEGRLCNLFRGAYTLNGEQFQAGAIVARRTTCPEPAMSAETTMFAMLRQPLRATVSRWGTLVLTAGRDVVTLRPARR